MSVDAFPFLTLRGSSGTSRLVMPETESTESMANPVAVVQGIGAIGRNFLVETGAMFWFIANTLQETVERIRDGRLPFSAESFFRNTERSGVDSVPLVGLVSFFLGLTM